MRIRRTVAGVALTTLSAGLLATIPFTAAKLPPDLVISQVYGGGGNSGATYNARLRRDLQPRNGPGLRRRSLGPVRQRHRDRQPRRPQRPADRAAGRERAGRQLLPRPGGGWAPTAAACRHGRRRRPVARSRWRRGAGKVALVTGTTSLGVQRWLDPVHHRPSSPGSSTSSATAPRNFFEGTGPAPALSNTTAGFRARWRRHRHRQQQRGLHRWHPCPAQQRQRRARRRSRDPMPAHHRRGPGRRGGQRRTSVRRSSSTASSPATSRHGGQFGGFFIQSRRPDADPLTSDGIRVFRQRSPPSPSVTSSRSPARSTSSPAPARCTPGTETQLGSAPSSTETGTARQLPAPIELSPALRRDRRTASTARSATRACSSPLPSGLIATDLFTLGRFGEVSLTTDELLRIPTTAAEDAANNADRITLDDGCSGQNLEPLCRTRSTRTGTTCRAPATRSPSR